MIQLPKSLVNSFLIGGKGKAACHLLLTSAPLFSLTLTPIIFSNQPVWAQTSTVQQTVSPDAPTGPIRIRDTISVQIIGEASLSGQFSVGTDGTVTLPLIGAVKVVGLTPSQTGDSIAATYKMKNLLRNPQIVVTILRRPERTVTVAGALEKQGPVILREGTRLNEVLEPAGILATSDLSKIMIMRGEKTIVVDYLIYRSGNDDPTGKSNLLLEDGDKIYVRARIQVYGTVRINGEVKTPQVTNLVNKTTVFQAIQLAGGITEMADKEKIVIIRDGMEIPVSYKSIQEGKRDKDLMLQDKDEIFVRRAGTINVNGEVKTPLVTNLVNKITAFQAIQLAGGITEMADREKIVVIRAGIEIPISYRAIQEGQMDKDIVLQDKDEIFVRKIDKPKVFFVNGGVVNKSKFPLVDTITLSEAIAAAGGALDGANLKMVTVQRKSASGLIDIKTYDLTLSTNLSIPIVTEDVISVPYPPIKSPKKDILTTLGSLSGILFLLFRR